MEETVHQPNKKHVIQIMNCTVNIYLSTYLFIYLYSLFIEILQMENIPSDPTFVIDFLQNHVLKLAKKPCPTSILQMVK